MHVIDASVWQLAVVVLICVGIFVGTLDMAKALFRRYQQIAEQDRRAVDFALANFDKLTDLRKRGLITHDSLLMSKMGFSEPEREHIDRLLQRLNNYGHVIETINTGMGTKYVFAMNREDLKRVRANLG